MSAPAPSSKNSNAGDPGVGLRVFRDLAVWQAHRKQLSGSVGFVPTMGALHAGHASLIERSRAENDHTVLSIYLNPTQFNNPKDLEKYPRTLERDLRMACALHAGMATFAQAGVSEKTALPAEAGMEAVS